MALAGAIFGGPGTASASAAQPSAVVVEFGEYDPSTPVDDQPYVPVEDEDATAARPEAFKGVGDYVHKSKNHDGTTVMSGHGWWIKISGPATTAVVTVQIQQHWGDWRNVGSAGQKTVRPGGGSTNRAVGRGPCTVYPGHGYHWRSVIDVDIVGYPDTPDKTITGERRTDCSAFGIG